LSSSKGKVLSYNSLGHVAGKNNFIIYGEYLSSKLPTYLFRSSFQNKNTPPLAKWIIGMTIVNFNYDINWRYFIRGPLIFWAKGIDNLA